MDFPALKEARGELNAAREDLHKVFEQAGPELNVRNVKGIEGDVVEYIRAKNEEIEEKAAKVKGLEAVAKGAENAKGFERGAEAGAVEGPKDLGSRFVKSAAFGSKGAVANLDIEVKTLMTTAAGWAPESVRSGRVMDDPALRQIQVTDIFPQGGINQPSYVYMQEDAVTNAAGETAEGGTYHEQALSLSEVTEAVRKLTVWLPITDEQLDDEFGVSGYVNRRLPFLLRQKLDSQLLNGSGTGTPAQLKGVLSVSGIGSQAKGTDPAPDAVYKAITSAEVDGQANPDYVVMHSTDWQNIRLLRTADGVYIWGSPAEAGQARIWGLPVVKTQVLSAGTALVGDFGNFSDLLIRRGLEVQTTNSHGTHFVEGTQAIRADMRCVLAVYRAKAFTKVTGL